MASNTNLSVARVALAAINMTLGNKKKFSPVGALQAARSPQNAGLIAEMNPKNANDANRLSTIPGQTTPQARVTLNYRPQEAATIKTNRTVATGSNPTQATSLNVDFVTHRELDLTYRTVDILALEKQTEDYLNKSNNGALAVNIANFPLLSDMGDQIMKRADSVLVNVDTAVLTALVAGVGGNLMLGTSSNTGVPTITAFNSDGSVNPYVMDWFADLKNIHQFEGKPIVIGGLKALRYFNRKNIVSAAALGYDYAKVFDMLDVEFYYDPQVDTLSGTDHIIVMDAGAFCMESIMEHAPVNEGGVIPMTHVGNTSYGQASITIAQTTAPTFTLDHDIRVREDDSSAYPAFTITPSVHFGTFARPAGFFKNYAGWDTVTGIFRAKLI
ncbi:hypothetical protein [Spirosoma sp.]|uniref:hypothetical protein n=1 Tax=Spirosoma sp. TaxID=1899569 RepID=UPI0026289364|nr:hypothetical protein [Spirosoma sp.]MCX6217602.1 hypothetical protein [Spirosoma sp.]